MAEREGFEPPIPFRVCRFSRPEPSTTRPPLRAENTELNSPMLSTALHIPLHNHDQSPALREPPYILILQGARKVGQSVNAYYALRGKH